MNTFDFKAFSVGLVAEAMFYDAEFGAIGTLSLVSKEDPKELYIAYYLPEDQRFVIEEATDWESDDSGEEEAIGYALAVDTTEHMASKSQEEIALRVMELAAQHNLRPSVSLFFEEEEEG